ncbi:Mov34-domain-containing protein [Tilletiaria anomala UBC 951]|uniref:COP9 signalosome complex subunit 5 n=1 Tax=Tilletiaria anomala (strain ATCC 24038 / CBS 436.72 / UBC 951) TaxID=1037660 RepID=A0A066VC81_TILAU|nr:Mov34-domain-containing protein [Tilletiaria anomala UBC 951]KDN39096.1 Mov34-domain-containing protein [Tilletiaria anomala UBC 951]
MPPLEASTSAVAQETMARQNFELNNDMVTLDASDAIFHYDPEKQREINERKPWKQDPHFFQKIRISAVALIKMVMHARSGGIYEIMGLMQGKVDVETRTMYVMDSFALPVQGTETRVNAQAEAYEYMVEYNEASRHVDRLENAIGWYHSHPGYGCWLSGIDVSTQSLNQKYSEPWVAIVIDPNRTISAGKVDIGAFRTFPEDYKSPTSAEESEYQNIPYNKIEDFGVHANQYYPLQVEIFKSSLDDKLLALLWNKYWVSTLSQSPLIVNRSYTAGQVKDLAEKLSRTQQKVLTGRSNTVSQGASLDIRIIERWGGSDLGAAGGLRGLGGEAEKGNAAATSIPGAQADAAGEQAAASKEADASQFQDGDLHPKIAAAMQELHKRDDDTALSKAAKDAAKLASEAQHGLIHQVLKDIIFNRGGSNTGLPPLM